MDNTQFENIREKLYDVQVPVDADIWSGIESGLRRRKIRRVFLYASSAAAIIIAALLIFTANPEEPHISSMVAQHTKVQQTYEKTSTVPVSGSDGASGIKPVPMPSAKRSLQAEESPAAAVAYEAAAPGNQDDASLTQTNEAEAAEFDSHKDGTTEKPSAKQEEKDYKPLFNLSESEDYVAGVSAKRKGYAVKISSGVIPGSSASVSGGIIKASSAGAGNISQSYTVEQISDTKHSLPLNLGVQFQFPVAGNMALGIGVNYTMLKSRYDCLINKKKFDVKQSLHYIGIPVNVYGLITEKNRFRFYVNAGATLEKGIRAVYDLKSYDQTEHNSSSIDGLQFSVNAGMGVEYILGNTAGLYLEPNIVYYMDSDVPQSIRTDQPLQVKAELGFRFRF